MTDARGCAITANFTIYEPAPLTVNVASVNAGCNGTILGSAQAGGVGGTPGYTFLWSHGPSGNNIGGLSPNTYTVTAIDARGCLATNSVVIGDTPAQNINSAVIARPTCYGGNDGSIVLDVSGGVPPLVLTWSNSVYGTSNLNLAAGTYTVTITDAIGCRTTTSATITQPQPIRASTTVTAPVCYGDLNGSITVQTVTNGARPYLYSIDGGVLGIDSTWATLAQGQHILGLSDVNGCTWQSTVTVPNALPITVDLGSDATINFGDSLTLKPRLNSFAAVTYQWSPTTGLSCTNCHYPTARPLVSTTYGVTVTDANGCTATDTQLITVIDERTVYIPNTFTPDSDGINDGFTVYGGSAIDKIQLVRIFDRWGEMVYQNTEMEANAPTKGWDGTFKGKMLNNAVFVYYIQVRFADGAVQTFSGDVTLVK